MTIIADTGILVALIDPDTREHDWVREQTTALPIPFLTSEAVLSETAFLLARDGFDADELFELAERGMIVTAIDFNKERKHLRSMMRIYREVPMSLADASLVRLSEMHRHSCVFTLDFHFRIYRRERNKSIPVLMPDLP